MNILVTGASGFLGQELIKHLDGNVRAVARNEGKLIALQQTYPQIEILTGDIADEFICEKALKDIDKVYHLAAFKHIGLAETQSRQCTRSNVLGTLNLLQSFQGEFFIGISTDKAAQVNGVYGATKLVMEALIREYEKLRPNTRYRVVRYGNILYSTGSVLTKWKEALLTGQKIVVTEPKATRFFWTIEQAVQLIFDCEQHAINSEPYCPTMKSMAVCDLLEAMQIKYGRASQIETIGLQRGENLHEKITKDGLSSNEAERFTIEEILSLI